MQTSNFPRGCTRAPDCAWAHACMQYVSVGQKNPLGQVMWVSNPLEGYRIPSSAVHSLSALSKTLTGPRARACQARRQSDGEPPPWCTGPWLSPTHCHWGRTLGGLRSLQHNPDVLQWCVIVCRYMRAPRSHAHVLLTKGMGLCQQRVNAD